MLRPSREWTRAETHASGLAAARATREAGRWMAQHNRARRGTAGVARQLDRFQRWTLRVEPTVGTPANTIMDVGHPLGHRFDTVKLHLTAGANSSALAMPVIDCLLPCLSHPRLVSGGDLRTAHSVPHGATSLGLAHSRLEPQRQPAGHIQRTRRGECSQQAAMRVWEGSKAILLRPGSQDFCKTHDQIDEQALVERRRPVGPTPGNWRATKWITLFAVANDHSAICPVASNSQSIPRCDLSARFLLQPCIPVAHKERHAHWHNTSRSHDGTPTPIGSGHREPASSQSSQSNERTTAALERPGHHACHHVGHAAAKTPRSSRPEPLSA